MTLSNTWLNDIFSDISYDNETKRIELIFKCNIVKVQLCGGLHFAFGFTKTILKDPDPEFVNITI